MGGPLGSGKSSAGLRLITSILLDSGTNTIKPVSLDFCSGVEHRLEDGSGWRVALARVASQSWPPKPVEELLLEPQNPGGPSPPVSPPVSPPKHEPAPDRTCAVGSLASSAFQSGVDCLGGTWCRSPPFLPLEVTLCLLFFLTVLGMGGLKGTFNGGVL